MDGWSCDLWMFISSARPNQQNLWVITPGTSAYYVIDAASETCSSHEYLHQLYEWCRQQPVNKDAATITAMTTSFISLKRFFYRQWRHNSDLWHHHRPLEPAIANNISWGAVKNNYPYCWQMNYIFIYAFSFIIFHSSMELLQTNFKASLSRLTKSWQEIPQVNKSKTKSNLLLPKQS